MYVCMYAYCICVCVYIYTQTYTPFCSPGMIHSFMVDHGIREREEVQYCSTYSTNAAINALTSVAVFDKSQTFRDAGIYGQEIKIKPL